MRKSPKIRQPDNRKWLLCALICGFLAFRLSGFVFAASTVTQEQLAAVRAVEQQRIATVNKVYGAVVAVYGKNRQGGGSGVIFDPEGYALTNFHVVRATGPEGFGGLADGHLYSYKLIGLDPGGDIALIKLQPPADAPKDKPFAFPYVRLGDDDTVRVGDFVMAMGNPFVLAEDQTPTVTLGIVSGVKRYQEGQGGTNLLEYGDCIQIDSSINPGNSGGPLFNMRGELLGINGRGSFEERGRVNVGVGYAIGINQIKRFLPDLLATKIAMHATLKATFGTRAGVTVCDQIDLDSKAYEAGLRLGDKLLRFDGLDITSANQFKNHLTTLPAGWPVELVWEREGKEQSVWLRLDAAPYPKAPPRPQPKVQPKPGDKDDEKPDDDKPSDDDKPADTDKHVAPPPEEPGKIRDEKQNKVEVGRILKAYRQFLYPGDGAADHARAWRYETQSFSLKDGTRKLISRESEVSAPSTKFYTSIERVDTRAISESWWDGKTFWTREGDGAVEIVNNIDDPSVAMVYGVGEREFWEDVEAADALERFNSVELQGSDQIMGEPTYRLRFVDKHDRSWRVWFSVFGADGATPQVRAVKLGMNDANDSGFMRSDYRLVEGAMLAHRFGVVTTLGQTPRVEIVMVKAEVISKVDDAMFRPPNVKP